MKPATAKGAGDLGPSPLAPPALHTYATAGTCATAPENFFNLWRLIMMLRKNQPMFNVNEAKLKQHLRNFMQNGCIGCVHNETCELPLHGKFKFGGPTCPQAEPISPMEMFKLMWGPALIPAHNHTQKRKGE